MLKSNEKQSNLIVSAMENNLKFEKLFKDDNFKSPKNVSYISYKKRQNTRFFSVPKKDDKLFLFESTPSRNVPSLTLDCSHIKNAKALNNEFKKIFYKNDKIEVLKENYSKEISSDHIINRFKPTLNIVTHDVNLSLDYNLQHAINKNLMILRRYMLNTYEVLEQNIHQKLKNNVEYAKKIENWAVSVKFEDSHAKQIIDAIIDNKKVGRNDNTKVRLIDNFMENVLQSIQRKAIFLTEKNVKLKEEDIINLIQEESNKMTDNLEKYLNFPVFLKKFTTNKEKLLIYPTIASSISYSLSDSKDYMKTDINEIIHSIVLSKDSISYDNHVMDNKIKDYINSKSNAISKISISKNKNNDKLSLFGNKSSDKSVAKEQVREFSELKKIQNTNLNIYRNVSTIFNTNLNGIDGKTFENIPNDNLNIKKNKNLKNELNDIKMTKNVIKDSLLLRKDQESIIKENKINGEEYYKNIFIDQDKIRNEEIEKTELNQNEKEDNSRINDKDMIKANVFEKDTKNRNESKNEEDSNKNYKIKIETNQIKNNSKDGNLNKINTNNNNNEFNQSNVIDKTSKKENFKKKNTLVNDTSNNLALINEETKYKQILESYKISINDNNNGNSPDITNLNKNEDQISNKLNSSKNVIEIDRISERSNLKDKIENDQNNFMEGYNKLGSNYSKNRSVGKKAEYIEKPSDNKIEEKNTILIKNNNEKDVKKDKKLNNIKTEKNEENKTRKNKEVIKINRKVNKLEDNKNDRNKKQINQKNENTDKTEESNNETIENKNLNKIDNNNDSDIKIYNINITNSGEKIEESMKNNDLSEDLINNIITNDTNNIIKNDKIPDDSVKTNILNGNCKNIKIKI